MAAGCARRRWLAGWLAACWLGAGAGRHDKIPPVCCSCLHINSQNRRTDLPNRSTDLPNRSTRLAASVSLLKCSATVFLCRSPIHESLLHSAGPTTTSPSPAEGNRLLCCAAVRLLVADGSHPRPLPKRALAPSGGGPRCTTSQRSHRAGRAPAPSAFPHRNDAQPFPRGGAAAVDHGGHRQPAPAATTPRSRGCGSTVRLELEARKVLPYVALAQRSR
eukprot:SAG25_NODE_306_length_10078_cov_13.534923_3_plen_219_part_00